MKKILLIIALITALIAGFFLFSRDTKTSEIAIAKPKYKSILDVSAEKLHSSNISAKSDIRAQKSEVYIKKDGNLDKCESIVRGVLSSLPSAQINYIQEIDLSGIDMERRGFGGYGKIELQCIDVADYELAGVLIHEIGHVVDTDYLKGTSKKGSAFIDFKTRIPSDDLSLKFYEISWTNEEVKNAGSVSADFVTTYGATDPFEDFAETYLMYIAHGNQFKDMALNNKILEKKYEFMKNFIFDGKEFDTDSAYTKAYSNSRVYDATRIEFPLAKFITV